MTQQPDVTAEQLQTLIDQLRQLTTVTPMIIRQNILPYDDLQLMGDKPTYLELFKDIGLVLAMLTGIAPSGPKLVDMTDKGALLTADVGGGFTTFTHFVSSFGRSSFHTFQYPEVVGRSIVQTQSASMEVQVSLDNITYTDNIVVPPWGVLGIDLRHLYLKATNIGFNIDSIDVYGFHN